MELQDTELHDLIDGSFGDGPEHRPVGDRVTAGRRAVTRRRLATAAGTAAVLAIVGTGAWLTGGDADRAAESPAATDPSSDVAVDDSPAPSPSKRSTELERQRVLSGDTPAGYDGTGRLLVERGWRITERIPNPMDFPPPSASVALELTKGTKQLWVLVTNSVDGDYSSSGTSWDPAGKSFATLADWTADQVALQVGAEETTRGPGGDLVRMDGDGILEATSGVTVLRQLTNPDIPGFAGPDDPTATAKVLFEGKVWFVLARHIPGADPEYFPVDAGILERPTMAAFLAHCRTQYAGGEGLK